MTSLKRDGDHYLAVLIVTRRRLEAAEAGTLPIDDETLDELGERIRMCEVKLRELCPPRSITANVVRMSEWRQRKCRVML